tara:strand:- start:4420 stop:4869 length:450 start_codon:yes stop_codon:yes gene_type:complete
MATLKPTLSLSSTDAHSDPLSMAVTASSIVSAPSTGISVISTDDNPLGAGAGVLVEEDPLVDTYVYIKHTGKKNTAPLTDAAAGDKVIVTNVDGTATGIKLTLHPGEFAYFCLAAGTGGSGIAGTQGGLKIAKVSGNDVMVEYGCWRKT